MHPLCLLWVHPSRVAALSEKNKWERPKTEARQTQIQKTKDAKIISNNETTMSLRFPKKAVRTKQNKTKDSFLYYTVSEPLGLTPQIEVKANKKTTKYRHELKRDHESELSLIFQPCVLCN